MAESGSYDEATLARRYAMAQKLMEQGQQPVKHWAQGLANLANSALGGYEFSKAEDERRAEKAKGGADLYAALGLAAPAAAAEPSQGGFQRLAALLQGSPAAAPIAPGGDQASYPAPPAAPPSPTTFRPGITAPAAPPVAPPGAAPDYSKAIAGIESGSAYDKLGPQTKTGDRAYGKYQVMGNNVPEWTTQVLGKPMTPEQFLSNPEAQEAVFKAKFGDYVQKYGPEGAAKAWFAGEKGMNNPAGTDRIVRDGKVIHPGLSVAQYGQKFTQALGPQAAPQIASALTSPDAALPPGATPAQGALPTAAQAAGAPAGVLSGVAPETKLQIAKLLSSNNPTAKAMGTALLQSQMAPAQHIDLGNKVGIMDRQGNLVRTIDKGEPNRGPTFGDTGEIDPQTGQPVKGWIDPRDKSVMPYRPQGAAPAQPSTIPPVPPGVDPKVWREAFSKATAAGAAPASFEDTAKLRHEVTQLPSYKNLSQAAPIYESMRDAAGRDTKAADLNMVYGLGKIMDPTSVVREGELQMANAAQGIQERLNGLIAQIQSKGALTPEGRQALMAEAHGRVTAYKGEFDRDAGRYKGIAERNRMGAADVIPEFGTFEPWTAPKNVAPVEIDGYKIKAK